MAQRIGAVDRRSGTAPGDWCMCAPSCNRAILTGALRADDPAGAGESGNQSDGRSAAMMDDLPAGTARKICLCMNVTDREIADAYAAGHKSIAQIREATRACTR